MEYSSRIIKLYNYYNDALDYLTILYQIFGKIFYMTFKVNKDIYNINSKNSLIKIKTNEEINFDISSLIEAPRDFGKLYISQMKTIDFLSSPQKTTTRFCYEFLEFPIDKENQKITIDTSASLWYELSFIFTLVTDDYAIAFMLPNTKLSI